MALGVCDLIFLRGTWTTAPLRGGHWSPLHRGAGGRRVKGTRERLSSRLRSPETIMATSFPPDDILIQVTPRLPISDIWDGLTRPEHLEKWFAPRVHIEPYEGGAFELFWDDEDPPRNSTSGCRFLSYKDQAEMTFTWKAPPLYAELMNTIQPLTTVNLRVDPCPEGIDVTLEHRGWKAGDSWEEARSWHFHYWDRTLHRFRDYIMGEGQPDAPTRE